MSAVPSTSRLSAEERRDEVVAAAVSEFSQGGLAGTSTDAIARRLQEGNRRVLLPFVEGPDMEAAEHRPSDPLVATRYGPREPAERVPVEPGDIDLAVVPGLAFDRLGYRVGYGGGHYDRYLGRLHPEAARVGIGFGPQLVDEVPVEEGDERVDLVVTDEGVVRRAEPG